MHPLVGFLFLTFLASTSSQPDLEEDPSLEDTLFSAALAPSGEFSCTPELGFIRKGGVYNEPSETLTVSPTECCRLCFEDPRCETWARKRSTGECALMNIVPPLRESDDHDSGLLAVEALGLIPEPDCVIDENVYFPDGQVVEITQTNTANSCCKRCIADFLCFSWYFERATDTCVLNANAPEARNATGYKGYALV